MALTNRGRNVVRMVASASLLVVIGAGFSAVGNASDTHSLTSATTAADAGYVTIVVAPGESLWSVASLVVGNGSVASVIDEIVSVNHLNSTDVAAGNQ